jgi:hypothetical protein
MVTAAKFVQPIAIAILVIILPLIFVRSISRRSLDQTLWNLVGISHAMRSCAVYCWFFHTLRWIFLRCSMKLDEKSHFFLNSPLFYFHGNCGKVWKREDLK